MFAPHCPSCECRVLLGPDRIVRFEWTPAGSRIVVLRCTCGQFVDWDQRPLAPLAATA